MEKEGVSEKHYQAVHYWLKYKYGKATRCENKNCENKSKKYSWAKKRNKNYDYKRVNFIQLCGSCHRKYDCTEEMRNKMREHNKNTHKTHCLRGHKFTEENTYWYKKSRRCKKCKVMFLRNYRSKLKLLSLKQKSEEEKQ